MGITDQFTLQILKIFQIFPLKGVTKKLSEISSTSVSSICVGTPNYFHFQACFICSFGGIYDMPFDFGSQFAAQQLFFLCSQLINLSASSGLNRSQNPLFLCLILQQFNPNIIVGGLNKLHCSAMASIWPVELSPDSENENSQSFISCDVYCTAFCIRFNYILMNIIDPSANHQHFNILTYFLRILSFQNLIIKFVLCLFNETIHFFIFNRSYLIQPYKDMANAVNADADAGSYSSLFHQTLQTGVDLAKGVFVGVYTVVTTPPLWVYGLVALLVSVLCLLIYLNRRWVEAKPNQWLLVIRNGKMVKAGVGLKTYKGPLDTIVTFPSKVQRVYFSANNVTVQMQGIIIEGFAFWSIYRDDDGPFRCYKYLQGCDANDSVRALSEGVLRNLIANSTIDQVMRNRNHLRVNMQKQLKDQFKGWGIWLESVEITEVKISSDKLFKDLQAQFRQETRLKAELIELNSAQKTQESRQTSELKMFEKNETNETRRLQMNYEQELKRKIQEESYLSGKNNLEIQKMARDKDIQIQRIKNEQEKEVQRLKNSQQIQKDQQDFTLEAQKRSIQMDKLYDEKSFKKYKIDAAQKIYNSLGIKDLKLNQYSSDSTLTGVLPLLGKKQE